MQFSSNTRKGPSPKWLEVLWSVAYENNFLQNPSVLETSNLKDKPEIFTFSFPFFGILGKDI